MAIAVGFATGWTTTAWAVNADNRVGNPRYDVECRDGSPGSAAGPVCRTDGSNVDYYMDSSGEFALEADDRSVVTSIMQNRYDPTDLFVTYEPNPTFGGCGETDIIYQEGTVQSGFVGVTWCDDSSPSPRYECDQQYVRIRGNGEYNNGVTCHETGHAVGLVHGDSANPATSQTDGDLGCMRTPTPAGSGLGQNQIARINQMY